MPTQIIMERSKNCCEICQSPLGVHVHEIPGSTLTPVDRSLALCQICDEEYKGISPLTASHWFALKETVWSEVASVKVFSNLVLQKLANESWARDLLDQMYLEDDLKEWVDSLASVDTGSNESSLRVVDSNGTQLLQGDSVTLIKDLEVKGANFTAKRGTLVKNINLTDDPMLIEGRVNGTQIVLKTQFLKRATV